MLSKKCDICGRYYDHYGSEDIHAVIEIRRYNPQSIIPIAEEVDRYDLCPRCINDLLYFLNALKTYGPGNVGIVVPEEEADAVHN